MDTTAARDAVLQTYEHLENIIAHLPASDILSAKMVNKAWCSVANSSKAVSPWIMIRPDTAPAWSLGYDQARYRSCFDLTSSTTYANISLPTQVRRSAVLYPSKPHLPRSSKSFDDLQKEHMKDVQRFQYPDYGSTGVHLKLHPQLEGAARLRRGGWVYEKAREIEMTPDLIERLEGVKGNFVSKPQCCAIGMSYHVDRGSMRYGNVRVYVYAREGLRVKHLLEALPRDTLPRAERPADTVCLALGVGFAWKDDAN